MYDQLNVEELSDTEELHYDSESTHSCNRVQPNDDISTDASSVIHYMCRTMRHEMENAMQIPLDIIYIQHTDEHLHESFR